MTNVNERLRMSAALLKALIADKQLPDLEAVRTAIYWIETCVGESERLTPEQESEEAAIRG